MMMMEMAENALKMIEKKLAEFPEEPKKEKV